MTSKLSDAQLVTALRAVPLFAECTVRQVRAINAAGTVVSKAAGSSLVSEGKNGVAFFVLLSGEVAITRDSRPVATLLPGDFFGEMALLSGGARNATATAATDVELFALTEWTFKKVLLEDPHIAYAVTRAVAARATAG